MDNFTFYSPTYFVFGKDEESKAGELVRKFGGSRVLVVYGGGSVVRSGLLERVGKSLESAGIVSFQLGGVKPNPRSGSNWAALSPTRGAALSTKESSFAGRKVLISCSR